MLNILTLAYQAEPFIEFHLAAFEALSVPWRWVIVHGPSNNEGSTSWCQPQAGGLSTDGTAEYINSLLDRGNIGVIENVLWRSKDAMCNSALSMMKTDGVLMQIDSDELWKTEQLEEIARLFHDFPQVGSMRFNCRYFVGPDLIATGEDAWGGNDNSWLRAHRFTAGQRWISHEPPVLEGTSGYCMSRHQTARCGLIFDHHAYELESQVAFKAKFYGGRYWNAVAAWKQLQQHTEFPTPLRQFFPWIPDDRTMVEKFRCCLWDCLGKGFWRCKSGDSYEHFTLITEEDFPAIAQELSAAHGAQREAATGAGVHTKHAADTTREEGDDPCALQSSFPASISTKLTVDVTNASASSAAPTFNPNGAANRFCHSGDLGDCISSLPAVRALGGGTYVLTDSRDGQRGTLRGRYDSLKSLLEVQPYIHSVEWQDAPTGITHDFRPFRARRLHGSGLIDNHAQQVGTDVRTEPWLTVPMGPIGKHDRVVFARSGRYQNQWFPWNELAQRFGENLLFVGLESEHKAMRELLGRHILFYPTADLLELAQVIAGASLFVGNQSLPFWIAAGLGVPLIQEVWEHDMNSVVERDNAYYPRSLENFPRNLLPKVATVARGRVVTVQNRRK